MTLYHFTAARFVDRILAEGLTLGALLVEFKPGKTPKIDTRYRWLTASPEWDQEWSHGTGRLPYKRNERRLTVEIPKSGERDVLVWNVVGPYLSREYAMLSAYGDPHNWRLFNGSVPREWIVAVDRNPLLSEAA